jgi:serine protease inhibitor
MDNQPQQPSTNNSTDNNSDNQSSSPQPNVLHPQVIVSPNNSQPPYLNQTSLPESRPKNKRARYLSKFLVGLGILVLIAAVIVGVYYFKNHKNTPSVATSTASAKKVNGSVSLANDNFGINAFNYLVKQSPNNNIFISPASISMALSMVYNGAEGSTKTAMQKTLDYQGLSLSTINNSNSALISSLSNPDPKVTLSIANSAWLKQGYPINSGFLNTVKSDYKAKAESLNFNDPSAPNTINSWVSNATNGKIPTIVNNIPSNEILYLINAVYFKGEWHTVFDPSATQDYPFTTSTNTQVQTPLMSSTSNYNYYEDNSVQAIELPYGKNQRLSMNVYLPTDMSSFLKNLSHNQLSSISSKLTQQQGTIMLPKFTLNYSQNLNDTLKALGMTVAFDPYGAANFNGIAKNAYITDVEHKTYISVDEQGTTAAAATSVGVGVATSANSGGFTMQVDKPFVFTIQDNTSKEVLFLGVIQNPNQ